MTTDNKPNDELMGTQPFNIDMDIRTTFPQGRGGFVSASTVETPAKVRR